MAINSTFTHLQLLVVDAIYTPSATPPVQVVIDDGIHGLLADFFDVEGLAEGTIAVLNDPEAHKHLGAAAAERIRESYGICKAVDDFVALVTPLVSGEAR